MLGDPPEMQTCYAALASYYDDLYFNLEWPPDMNWRQLQKDWSVEQSLSSRVTIGWRADFPRGLCTCLARGVRAIFVTGSIAPNIAFTERENFWHLVYELSGEGR